MQNNHERWWHEGQETWSPPPIDERWPPESLQWPLTTSKPLEQPWGGGSSTKNVSKTANLENDIFDNTGTHDAAMFHRSLKQIADYIQLNYGNEVFEAIRTMTPMIIDIPKVPRDKQDPDDPNTIIKVTDIDIYLWKEQHKKASAKLDKYSTGFYLDFPPVHS